MDEKYTVEGFKLDNNQIQLLKNDSNAIVIAGAGSGKTLTILGKVKYLIEVQNINPQEILLISFTNASVNDIKSRINYNINIFTFHKLAIHILQKNTFDFSICNSNLLNYIIQEYLKTCSPKEQKEILKFLDISLLYKQFLNSQYFSTFCNSIETFINFYKTNNLNINNIFTTKYTKNEKKILLIIFKIFKIYLNEKSSSNKLDFDDLIISATNVVKNTKLNFKYIIIDEFQDTSLIRLNLIKEIQQKENSKIIVVGDDWQSIYRFTGCDLNIFLNFSNYFKKVTTIKLSNTYRNSQELINIASKFILKNKNQITKELKSQKHILSPIILAPYKSRTDALKKILDKLLNYSNNIMILSRNNNDIYNYLCKEIIFENDYVIYKNTKIRFLTVHKSKGLETEYIILLNCNNDYLGFPNKIENNKIITKLIPQEKMPFAEERRLFYVAITRCKKQTYILYDKKNPSIFIKELKKIIKSTLQRITYFK